jgi:Tol biopolymer transport system component
MSNDTGLNLQYTWSRNGRFVVYASNHDGDFELYRLDWFNNVLLQLTNNAFFVDLQPSWSRP